MAIFVDARIPVVFAAAAVAGLGDALLIEGEEKAPDWVPVARFSSAPAAHVAGCACCVPRGPVAEALRLLFLSRARGTSAFFTRLVVATGEKGETAVRQALAGDAFLAGRYRLG